MYFCRLMKTKRDIQKQRMRIATLLLAVLIPAFLITTLHHHHQPEREQECAECAAHHHLLHKNHVATAVSDTWANCYICHYVFSPVEKAQLFEVLFGRDFVDTYFGKVVPSVCQSSHRYYSLRAPPRFLCHQGNSALIWSGLL